MKAMVAPSPGSPGALRRANRERVLEILEAGASLAQAEIARRTGLAASTVSTLVQQLAAEGAVTVADGASRGRAARLVSLAAPSGVVVGIDHGRFHLSVAIADFQGVILAERRVLREGGISREESLGRVDRLIAEALAEAGIERAEIRGGALALPAPIDSRTGRVGSAAILPGWTDIDPASACSEILGFPVSVYNDTNLGALGEARWGAGRGVSDLVYIWVSEGVGAGLILNGELYSGTGGIAGELGHSVHRRDSGDLCRCGNRGCLETVVSTRAVIRLLEPHVGPLAGFDQVVELAERGDVLCQRVLAETGRHIGVSVANLVNLVDPQRIVIGGELARAGELLIEAVAQMVRQYAIPSTAATVEIVPAELGDRAELLGAVSAALDECVRLSKVN
ncbi:MAG: ROK family protein [Leucobacter sp.]